MRHRTSKPTVMVVRNAASYDFGGAERLAVHIVQELRLNEFQAFVVSRHKQVLLYAESQQVPRRKGFWWSNQSWNGKRTLLLPIYLCWILVVAGWYFQLILRSGVDVVHLMSKDDFLAGTIAGKLLGKKVIWTDCADLKYIYANHRVWYKNPVGKLVFAVSRLADYVTLVSFNEQKLIEASLGQPTPANYLVIHIAGKDEAVTPLMRDKDDATAVIFCATSRLVRAKGILELIDAFHELSRKSDTYRLWLVGDGPDGGSCKERAGKNRHIVFWGHQEKPLQYVAASDVFTQPTYNEAFSLSLAEAAMLGKPMIATNVGGNPELVNEHNGILVPVQDVPALERAMHKLGSDKTLRLKLGKRAREDYMQKFDFSTIVKNKLLPLYEAG